MVKNADHRQQCQQLLMAGAGVLSWLRNKPSSDQNVPVFDRRFPTAILLTMWNRRFSGGV